MIITGQYDEEEIRSYCNKVLYIMIKVSQTEHSTHQSTEYVVIQRILTLSRDFNLLNLLSFSMEDMMIRRTTAQTSTMRSLPASKLLGVNSDDYDLLLMKSC